MEVTQGQQVEIGQGGARLMKAHEGAAPRVHHDSAHAVDPHEVASRGASGAQRSARPEHLERDAGVAACGPGRRGAGCEKQEADQDRDVSTGSHAMASRP